MRLLRPIFLSLICLLQGCSLIGKVPDIRYYELEPIDKTCFSRVEVTGKEHFLADRIMLRKRPHQVGALPNAYWISTFSNQIAWIAASPLGTKVLKLELSEAALHVENLEIGLAGSATVCLQQACTFKDFRIRKSAASTEPLDIVIAFQAAFQELVQLQLCDEH